MANLPGVKVGDVLRVRHGLEGSTDDPFLVIATRLTPKFVITGKWRFRTIDGKGFGYPAFDYVAEREATNENA